jgi:CheY-like chemotaxis protein
MARVLLVDDVPFIQHLVSSMIKNLGHQCDVAGSGAQAIEMARNGAYELIFMDLEMPDLHGFEVTKQLHGMGMRIPIIGFSGNSHDSEIQACFNAGMCGFVTKPPTPEVLKQAIEQSLAG